MKRFFVALCLLVITMVSGAQSRYTVYKCTDGVSVKKFRSNDWIRVNRHDEVSLVDFFRIEDGNQLIVLDSRNRNLYKFSAVKEKSLKSLIDEAVRKADNVTENLNKELFSKSDGGDKYSRVAAAYRGADVSAGFTDSLAVYVRGFMSGKEDFSSAICYDYTGTPNDFKLEVARVSEDECYFCFANDSAEDVFVNVVCVSADGSCSLCYDFGYSSPVSYVCLPSKTKVEMPQYLFLKPSASEKNLLLVTSRPYDTHALQMLLTSGAEK